MHEFQGKAAAYFGILAYGQHRNGYVETSVGMVIDNVESAKGFA